MIHLKIKKIKCYLLRTQGSLTCWTIKLKNIRGCILSLYMLPSYKGEYNGLSHRKCGLGIRWEYKNNQPNYIGFNSTFDYLFSIYTNKCQL